MFGEDKDSGSCAMNLRGLVMMERGDDGNQVAVLLFCYDLVEWDQVHPYD